VLSDLTERESTLIDQLPRPPATAKFRASNIWVVEWLPERGRRTGSELHEWLQQQRSGWSAYFSCGSKEDLLAAIEAAHNHTHEPDFSPVLHIEAHGCKAGLVGPDGAGGNEILRWNELTPILQKLNLATGCNLALVVAACTGFAAIQALAQGPRAPAIVLVGPDAEVSESDLLRGTKEFYRRWQDTSPRLTHSSESASREMAGVNFEIEPFALMAYEAQLVHIVRSLRRSEFEARKARLRAHLLHETELSEAEVDRRVSRMPPMSPWRDWQAIWDTMFMMDRHPENEERFGVDWQSICAQLGEKLLVGHRADAQQIVAADV
jgi:hypothetical protein